MVKVNRYEMGWSQADGAWMVVYASSLEEAEEKFEAGEYFLENDDIEADWDEDEEDY